MIWGTFFRDEMPQSAWLSAGGWGGAVAICAMFKYLRDISNKAFQYWQTVSPQSAGVRLFGRWTLDGSPHKNRPKPKEQFGWDQR